MGTPYFATYAQDLEQDPFDAVNFVEKIAWRITGGQSLTDPVVLKNKLEEEIASLQMLCDQFAKKMKTLEQQLAHDKKDYVAQLQKLNEQNHEAMGKMKKLDSTMQNVSSKVIHLGDQLESVNAPRQRAHDTLQLIAHFNEFLSDQPLNSDLFNDPDKLLESADLIQKLYSVSQELSKDKYAAVQIRIAHRYEEIEKILISEMLKMEKDEKRMAEVAKVLCEFKGYGSAVDTYISGLSSHLFRNYDAAHEEVMNLVTTNKPRFEKIFPQPTVAMQKMIIYLFSDKLNGNIQRKLNGFSSIADEERYLMCLKEEYSKSRKLCADIENLHIGVDLHLNMLLKQIFGSFLQSYPKDELKYVNRLCTSILNRFYEEKKHVKKQIQTGDKLSELKRDAQARFLTVDDYGGETFLSTDVAINVIQELKNAHSRAMMLCEPGEAVARQTEALFDVLLTYLHHDHLDYAVELALAGISLAEPKTEPPAYFFNVLAQNTTIMHLMSKQYAECVLPGVEDSLPEQTSVQKKWQNAVRSLENKLNVGMERQMNAIIGFVRYTLNNLQKKSDYVPDSGQLTLAVSPACTQIVRFLRSQMSAMEGGLDSVNLSATARELAIRLHKLLVYHIQQFYYNSAGGTMLVVDLNEYRRMVGKWHIGMDEMKSTVGGGEDATVQEDPRVLFDHLHALANLLVVVPEQVQFACNSSQLDELSDSSLINTFLQLRVDYRNLKWRP